MVRLCLEVWLLALPERDREVSIVSFESVCCGIPINNLVTLLQFSSYIYFFQNLYKKILRQINASFNSGLKNKILLKLQMM